MRNCLCILLLVLAITTRGQKNSEYKFNKIEAKDFVNIYSIDSNANAVVLADVGNTEIIGNSKGWFSFVFKRRKRVHILNKNGYNEATVEIHLFKDKSAEEKVESLKAITYTLENGNIVEHKLDKSNVFTEVVSKNKLIKKFTLPNVKEGSIIEIEYQIHSDFLFNLQPWAFQGPAPRLWSEYNLTIPEFFHYVFLSQGYQLFHINTNKKRNVAFTISDYTTPNATERYKIESNVTDYRWVMKDVPKLKAESFTSSIENFISKIEFQLAAFKHPLQYKDVLGSWNTLTKKLMEDEDFGRNLTTNNNWLGEIVNPLISGAATPLEKAKRIYYYLQENITCNNYNAVFASQPLKNVLKSKNGKVSDVNLLLTIMLKYAGIDADPVMLSTKDHGYVNPLYPLLSRFNYIITQVVIDNKVCYLDASRSKLGFGVLDTDCYNGHARVVNMSASPLELSADSLKEAKLTNLYMSVDNTGKWIGNFKSTPGYYESLSIRNKIQTKGKEEFIKGIKSSYLMDVDVQEMLIDSLTKYEYPITVKYNFSFNTDNEKILYVNPMFSEIIKENPFKSIQRFHPVEMPYAFDETYTAIIEVPKDYVVDELPKSIRVMYNEESEGMFEYIIAQSQNIISFRCRVRMDRANFDPEEYELLREFFNMVVSKQSENIVFKKKS